MTFVSIPPPPHTQRVRRPVEVAGPGEKRTRYHRPEHLVSASPVGFRSRVSLSSTEAEALLGLCALPRPRAFVDARPVVEQRLFEESALSTLLARQSTNFRGWRDIIVGGDDAERVAACLRQIDATDAPVLRGASHCRIVLSRPYRTPFTFLLTFIGHRRLTNLWGVAKRALQKRWWHRDDIPTIGYLQELHLGVLADAMERAVIIASRGHARAQVHLQPLTPTTTEGKSALAELESIAGLSSAEKRAGWRVGLVAQVGDVDAQDRIQLSDETWQRLGAALISLRSERIQPGVNAEPAAPVPYQARQDMDVPPELIEQCGRALYNAFSHFTGISRDDAKRLILLERIDVMTEEGKARLRDIRRGLDSVTERVIRGIPLWADLPVGRALSRNTARGKKAFALAGQRIYIGGLSKPEIDAAGVSFAHAIRALGAAAARAALVAEISGSTEIPAGCDLLAGICLMAGPINQNDIGKTFFQDDDLLEQAFPGRDPTSLLLWTLKAKTVADPIGNEEQLLNAARKGALVDLRPGPHEVIQILQEGRLQPMRARHGRINQERAFFVVDNFVRDEEGNDIPGNLGAPWPTAWSEETVFAGRKQASA